MHCTLSDHRIQKTTCFRLLLLAVVFALVMFKISGFHSARWLKDDDSSGSISQPHNDNHLDEEAKGNIRSQPVKNSTNQDVSHETCDKCCYRYTTIVKGVTKLLGKSELREKGCQQRLPDAIIFGVKKAGTTTLKNFISYHPDVAFSQNELRFFASPANHKKGIQYYQSLMMYSTDDQIAMEKTPIYSSYAKAPAWIKQALPNVKLIIIMRDPVKRAVSDYVHMQNILAKNMAQRRNSTRKMASVPNSGLNGTIFGYFIADTFDESIVDSEGQLRTSSPLISKGVYVSAIQRYLMYFKPEQILALDGEAFISDPYPAVKKVEQFLGIRDYFKRDYFYFDGQKGFFCLNKPIPNNCMREGKGRPHPLVQEQTLKKLRDYYRPYNKALNQLVNLDFRWSS